MTIEIERPELEALIHNWMRSGAFASVEDALIQALKSAPAPTSGSTSSRTPADLNGQALVAAMQASPWKDVDLEPARAAMAVRGMQI